MSKHRQRRTRSKRRKIAIASAAVLAVGAVGVPVAAQASGVGLGGLRSVAFSWWGGDTSESNTASRTPSRTPSVSATPSATDSSASPSGTPSPSRSRTSPSASPSKSARPTPTPTADQPRKTTSPPSTPKATRPATAPRTSTSSVDSGPTARVLALVNAERDKAGCAPVTENAKLTKAAQNHSQDMADHQNMSHTGSDGSSMTDRLARVGYAYRSAGENVAAGYGTPESVMDGWMNSSGHRANILNCGFKEIGIGLAQPGNYWTQNFGSSA
ncbi:CAP domain-containing protein [Streptomyces sp. CA-210063]|uniref:CAP domain-containing protein n=1 Tax=Streptomyces sp. CA-210063 TaxID=2801029 RepID=UPI00214C7C6F|nr:CAP domain-containing protein [Streptomyces sp. CA-210063]UUU32522.1 CAP domain-containing protein [Streptomyces sp. CA-210063]